MKKNLEVRTKLSLSRESIQLLDGGLRQARGAKPSDGCSIVSGCFSCRFPTCTTI